jgi:hypothetical protein
MAMKRYAIAMGLMVATVLNQLVAPADSVTLQPAADAGMRQYYPDLNAGSSPTMASGKTGPNASGEIRRAVVRFDLTGQVPSGAQVNSASVTLTVVRVPNGRADSVFELRRLLAAWSESDVTWNSRLAGVPWQFGGADGDQDRATFPSSTVPITALGAYTFPSTPELVADVQSWLDNPGTNFGWLLLSQDEQTYKTAREFGTRENPGAVPLLMVDYSIPPPSPPVILVQPQSQTVYAGTNVTLSVTATGAPPLSFQWLVNGTPRSTATNSVLTLLNVQTNDTGDYSVVVTNAAGSTNSQTARLTVLEPPPGTPVVTLLSPTNGEEFSAGVPILFAAEATVSNAAIMQVVFRLGTNVAGVATNSPYQLVVSNLAAGGYTLTAEAYDDRGGVGFSALVNFSVLPAVIVTSPTNGARFAQSAPILLAAEPVVSNSPVTQVEFLFGTNRAGLATNAPFELVVSNLPPDFYTLTARALADSQPIGDSPPVNFTVYAPPTVTLTAPPANLRTPLGSNLAISASVQSGLAVQSVSFFATRWITNGTTGGVTNLVSALGTLTSRPYTVNWTPATAGHYTLSADAWDELGQLGQSAPVPVVVFIPESIPPSLTLTSAPPNFARLSASTIRLAGTARDETGLDHIEYQVNNGRWFWAGGTTRWEAQVALPAGHATVVLRAVDQAGNFSRTITRYYTRVATDILTIHVAGGGQVSPNLDQKSLEIGKIYQVTAKPNSGQIFAAWEGAPYQGPVLNFQMASNLVLTARFVPNPFSSRLGTYAGVFAATNGVSPQNSGRINLQLTGSGAFSGKIKLQGKYWSFRSRFDSTGHAAFAIIRPGIKPLALNLQLDLVGSAGVTGTITDGSWVAVVAAPPL